MPIHSFLIQPFTNTLQAAYRPIVLRVEATATDATPVPPVVFCDVYLGNVYYKTFSLTQPDVPLNANNRSEWQFDIQDALQEYLKKYLASNGANQIMEALGAMTSIYCRFRSSGYNAGGFITPENTAPVQGTGGIDPTAGTGTQSNTFFGINATLQHEDHQRANVHLDAFKNGQWASNAWPLTHRNKNKYRICDFGSDFFPFAYTGNKNITCLKIYYRLNNQTVFTNVLNCALGCNLVIDTLDVFFTDFVSGQAYFHALWSMSIYAPGPEYYYVEYNDGSGWQPVVTDDRQINETFYFLPDKIEHDLRISPICENGVHGTPQIVHYSPIVGGCDPVVFTSTPVLPDGVAGHIYSYIFSLGGDAPIVMTVVTKPSWMTITLSGSTVTISGSPTTGDIGTYAVEVSFSNCSDTNTVDLLQSIEIYDELIVMDNVTVINASNTLTITTMSPNLSFRPLDFPLSVGNTVGGVHGAFTGVIWATITGFDLACRLVLKVNGSFVECKNIPAAGTYYFTSRAYLLGDEIEITLETGDC